jgi:hypothetical protein
MSGSGCERETGRQGDRGDRETGRQGDRETGRQGDRGEREAAMTDVGGVGVGEMGLGFRKIVQEQELEQE